MDQQKPESRAILQKAQDKSTKTKDKTEKTGKFNQESENNFKNIAVGVTSAILASLFVAASASSVQLLQQSVPDFELNSIRTSVPFFLTLVLFVLKRRLPVVPEPGFLYIIGYCVASAGTSITQYVSVNYVALGTVQSVIGVSSLISGALLCRIILKEKISIYKVLAIILAIIGIVLVVQPEDIFGHFQQHSHTATSSESELSQAENEQITIATLTGSKSAMAENDLVTMGTLLGSEPAKAQNDLITVESNAMDRSRINTRNSQPSVFTVVVFGYLFSILAGLAFTGETISLKLAETCRSITECFWDILFWSFLIQTWVSVILMYFLESFRAPQSTMEYILIAIHAVSYFMFWVFNLITVSKLDGNTQLLMLSTTIILCMVLAQYTVMRDIRPGHRNWMEIVGIVLVLCGCCLTSVLELWRGKC